MMENMEIPNSWKICSIDLLLDELEDGRIIHHGWSPRCKTHASPSDEIWGVLKTTAIQDGEFLGEHNKELPNQLKPRPNLEVKNGDILLTCAGPRNRCGVACYVRETRPRLMISGKMYRFRTRPQVVDPKYMEAFLRSRIARDAIDRMKTGISDSGLNLTHGRFKRLEVPVAPLLEQKRIVEKIDELFSELDAGVAALERAKANLKRYRASVLKAAVNGSLTADWRAKHPKVEPASQLLERILAERRHKWEEEQLAKFEAAGKKPPKDWEKKYKEPEPPLMEELPELPDGWCWSSVDQLCDVATGTTPSRGRLDYYENGSIPWVMSTAVNDPLIVNGTEMVTERALEETSLRLYPIGTLLIALYGEGKTRGMVSELKIAATINQALGALVFHESSECIRAYLKQFLWSRYLELRRKAAGGMQPNLNLGLVRQIAVPLPPVGEQVEIVRDVEEALTQIDAAQHAVHCSEIRSARLRQSILKVAFEGNLVPQDSNDESAKELLARITNKCEAEQTKKAHKAKAKPKKRIKIPKQVFENRAAVVSYTVQRLTSSQSFGRIQLLKTMHLAQCHLGIEMGFSFERYEAGPFDAAIYPLEKVAIKEDWFTTKERKRYGVTYHPGEKIDEMCQKAVEFLGEKKPELDQLLDHIAEMNTDEAELFATAYAAWNDLLLDDRSADDDAIIEEIYAWHEKKKKFTPDVIQKRLAWMRRHKFIPVGLRPGTSKATESERRSK